MPHSLLNKYSFFILVLSIGISIACIYTSCQNEDDFLTDPGVQLRFSVDTLRFDTVFTELGSATRQIRVINPENKPIQIERIFIDQDNDFFRMNVDGISGNDQREVEIPANDSIYIFVEVTIDPDNPLSISPFVITEHIRFLTNGTPQDVVVEAWGQNANYIPNNQNTGGAALFSCQFNEWVWDDPKPYVIYGILVVDSCTLRIPASQQVYVHGGLVTRRIDDSTRISYNDGRLIIGANGNLRVDGTHDQPVTFQGDRLESAFDDIPGQWFGILLTSGAEADINGAILKNSAFGIIADSASSLRIAGSQITNTSNNALTAIEAEVDAVNCLIAGQGGAAIRLSQGGNYNFDYCTFASYGNRIAAVVADNLRCLDPTDPTCEDFEIKPLRFLMRNCIISGSQDDELQFSNFSDNADDFDYTLDNCVVRVEQLPDREEFMDFFSRCDPCLNVTGQDPLFLDIPDDNYRLDSMSVADGFAIPLPGIGVDIENNNRNVAMPDAGCYELNL